MAKYVSAVCVNQQALLFLLTVRRMDMELDNCPKSNTDLVKCSQVEIFLISLISINAEC